MQLASPPPMYCSSCYGQNPQMRHVDFEASYDGPVRNKADVVGTSVDAQTIDWLVICEDCLRAAAGLIDMIVPDEAYKKYQALLASHKRLEKELEETEARLNKVKRAVVV